MDTREWYVVSDLHLNGEAGPRDLEAAFPRFLDTVVRASSPGWRRGRAALLAALFLTRPQRPVARTMARIA